MSLFDLVAKVHPLFRYGVPRPRERFIPIPTDAHLIVFDAARVGPAFTMHRITPSNSVKSVDRDDDFISELTLPDNLQTTNADYAAWNRDHPDDPMDKGHQTGSQVRRSDRLVQHDVDSLAGCCPETPPLNRVVKRDLESAIVKVAEEMIDVRCVQGPIWYGDAPRGKLNSGQWIPDAVFISCLMRPSNTRIIATSWVMQNLQSTTEVGLSEVCLDELESLTGLVLWDQIRMSSFDRQRSKIHNSDWWR